MQITLKPAAILALASLAPLRDQTARRAAHITRALLPLANHAPNTYDLLCELIKLDLVVEVTGTSYGLTGKAYAITAAGEVALYLGTVQS